MTFADLDGWLEGVTPLYGAHYLGEYWTDHVSHEWTPDWSRRPLAGVFDDAFAAIGRRSASFDYVLERSRGGARVPLFPDAHPFDVLRIPTLHGVGWFDNITPPHMLDYEALIANPETAPFQYLHAGSTDHENYQFERVPIPESEDHATQDDALERMLERYISPALDFFDAFLAGVADPGSVPRVRWHLPHLGWQESPSWPPPAASELRLYLAEAERAVTDEAGGALVPVAGERAEASWVHDPGDLVPSTLVNPFAALYEYPDERAIESRPDVLTFTTRGWDEPVTLTGRVVAHLELTSDAPSLFLHVKLVDVHPDGRAHTLLFGQRSSTSRAPERWPRSTSATRATASSRDTASACTSPRATSRSSSPTPARTRIRGTRRRRARTATRSPTGGETPSYVSLTVLPAAG